MIPEVLTPGMQKADRSDPGAKIFLVMGEFHERLRYGAKEKIVHDLPIHRYQEIQFRGDGEEHMEIRHGQEVLTASLDPSFFP
jgi:hypothetical protein